MERKEFENLVNEGIQAIPKKFRKSLDNVTIVVQDFPSHHQRSKMNLKSKWHLFGLYEGVPITERSANSYFGVLPDKITLFQAPIEYYGGNPERIRMIVKNTVWHEIGHHFGMDEEQVRAAEKRRGITY